VAVEEVPERSKGREIYGRIGSGASEPDARARRRAREYLRVIRVQRASQKSPGRRGTVSWKARNVAATIRRLLGL